MKIVTNQYKETEDNWSPWTVVYMYYVPVCTQKRLLTGDNNIRKSRNPAAVMGVLDAVARCEKEYGELYRGQVYNQY